MSILDQSSDTVEILTQCLQRLCRPVWRGTNSEPTLTKPTGKFIWGPYPGDIPLLSLQWVALPYLRSQDFHLSSLTGRAGSDVARRCFTLCHHYAGSLPIAGAGDFGHGNSLFWHLLLGLLVLPLKISKKAHFVQNAMVYLSYATTFGSELSCSMIPEEIKDTSYYL